MPKKRSRFRWIWGNRFRSDTSEISMTKSCCTGRRKGANQSNWQLGHLIESELQMTNMAVPGAMPPLPAGFAEKYSKDTATSDDASKFLKKDELVTVFEQQRAASLQALDKLSDSDL